MAAFKRFKRAVRGFVKKSPTILGSLLSGKDIPEVETPELDVATETEISEKALAERKEERKKRRTKKGRQSTLLTEPLGIAGPAQTTKKTLLGG